MPSKVHHGAPPPIALNQVFAHHGGRWKGKVFQPGPPPLPRAPFDRLARNAQRLGSRLLNVVTPDTARVGKKSQNCLEDADRDMGRVLGGLLHDVPLEKVARYILRFDGSAAFLTSAGVKPSQLFDIRARVHLAHMTPDELRRLATHLQPAIAESAGKPHESLKVLHRLVHREQAARTMLMAFKAIVQAAPQEPMAVEPHLLTAESAARGLLEKLGEPQDGTPLTPSHRYAVMKEVLNHALSSDALPSEALQPEQVRQLLDAMPSTALHALLNANHPQLFHPAGSLDAMLRQSIDQRRISLEQAVREHSAQAQALDPSTNLLHFADELTKMSTAWDALQGHCKLHGLYVQADLGQKVGALWTHLADDRRLDPERLALQIGRLQARQLVAFEDALRSLSLGGPYADLLTAEIQKRKGDSLKDAGNALRQAYLDLSKGNLPNALTRFERASEWAEEARAHLLKLGDAQWAGQEGHTKFIAHLIDHALAVADGDGLKPLYDKLNRKETMALAGTLQQIGIQQALELDDPRGAVVQNIGKFIEVMHTAIAEKLGMAANERHTLNEQEEEQPTLLLSQDACQQVSAFTGMKIFPAGTFGPASEASQALFQSNLDAMLAEPAPSFIPKNQKTGSGVSEAMYCELTTSVYAIEYSENHREPLYGDKAFRIDLLRTNARLSADELLLLSQVANKNVWASLDAAGTSAQDSPIQLPDGTPVKLEGIQNNSFTVHRGPEPDERLFVRCELVLDPLTAATNPATGMSTSLDLTKSGAWFSVELEIGKDRKVRISKPLTCSYTLVPKAA